jgi:hypothetical protein
VSTATAPARPGPQEGKKKKRAALARDLSELLVELSIAVHRYAMYPSDHPSLAPAAENVIRRLTSLLQDRSFVALGVARRQLVIEGVATDEAHPVLSDLARRLHSHHLALVRFDRGVRLEELKDFLRTVSEEPDRGGQAVGLLPEDHRPTWTNLRILPIGYDALELSDEEQDEDEPPRTRQLWIGLAQAALRRDVPEEEDLPSGRALAAVIEEKGGGEAYDKVIVGYLHQLAEELGGADGAEGEEARRMVGDLVEGMAPETLTRLLSLGGAYPQRKRFLLDANRARLTARSVVKILESAAQVEGQNISSSLTRLLSKLATHADGSNRRLQAQAESAIRDAVEDLISDWDLDDPNPDAYTQALDRMARSSPLLQDGPDQEPLPGADRIVRMALELDVGGVTLQKAVAQLLDEGRIGELFTLLDEAPEGNKVAEELLNHLTSPTQLQRLLSGGDIHEASLKAVVERIGTAAVGPLFEFLTESESRAVRRRAFDCLSFLDVDLNDRIMETLKDDRWFVQRNMLALLQQQSRLPTDFQVRDYLKHDDPRVRREALPLALAHPATRDQALGAALRDPDERIVRTALLELQEELPDTLVPVVVSRILRSKTFPQLRSLGAQALGANGSPLALNALLDLCSRKRFLRSRRRLASRSPEGLAALSALARNWPDDPKAAEILSMARDARDARIRAAASIPKDADAP